MITEEIDQLVERLRRGELDAAAELFSAYAAYLRAVVRRLLPNRLRAKFDSADVVQSVWVHLLRGLRDADWHFGDRASLRALLITLAQRRLISRVRHHAPLVEQECEGIAGRLPARCQPRPSELAQADELWEQMLNLCAPAHHDLLRLRRQGLSLAEIAKRTGMHEGSVRRIFRRLARDLMLREAPLARSIATDD